MARAIAVVTASCILLVGVSALQHEAAVAHVREGLTGEVQHAHALAEAHADATTPHLHGRGSEAHAEPGGCALLAAHDHVTILPTLLSVETCPAPFGEAIRAIAGRTSPALARYRLAPKTSPPSLG